MDARHSQRAGLVTTTLAIDHLDTPVGTLYIVANESALCAVGFPEAEASARTTLTRQLGGVRWCDTNDPLGATSQLRAYFAGELDALSDLPVAAIGTPFQRRVWEVLRRIPLGTVVSYGAIATAIGSPAACRAVGLANGRNPVAIVVPCHRVIGANATLTGYGGGLERKAWLLRHERANMNVSSCLPVQDYSIPNANLFSH